MDSLEITRVGDFRLGWGESLFWDDRRDRLYFVDCAASTLHWLDEGDPADADLPTWKLDSMPAGLVPTEDGRVVAALDDGLYVLDADARSCDLLARYPGGLNGRANDACADLSGNLITGKLNMSAEPGSSWRYSSTGDWKLIDPDISNTNGPAVAVLNGEMTLIIGDTATSYYSYPYDPVSGDTGPRRVFGDMAGLSGRPDGSTLDSDDGLWCALVGGSHLARFTTGGLDRVLPLPVTNPTDVTFGGPALDRLYVVSIGLGAEEESLDGTLLLISGLGAFGRAEPRFAYAG